MFDWPKASITALPGPTHSSQSTSSRPAASRQVSPSTSSAASLPMPSSSSVMPCPSVDDDDTVRALALDHVDGHVVLVPAQEDVDPRFAETQIPDAQLLDQARKRRALEADLAAGLVAAQAEAGLEQRERRGARPGLGRAGDGI